MMMNLFSTFDPSTSMNISMNWSMMTMPLLLLPMSFWLMPSRMNTIINMILNSMHKNLKMLMNINKVKGNTYIMISLFMLIMINNSTSLFPYIFPSTSHMTLNLTLSLTLWTSFTIFNWWNEKNTTMAHLVPKSTPMLLTPFMVMIETISNLMRPMTLSIRLTANVTSGHLLLTIMGKTGSKFSLSTINILILIQLLMLIMELMISIIQSYVFSMLSTLYSKEIQ